MAPCTFGISLSTHRLVQLVTNDHSIPSPKCRPLKSLVLSSQLSSICNLHMPDCGHELSQQSEAMLFQAFTKELVEFGWNARSCPLWRNSRWSTVWLVCDWDAQSRAAAVFMYTEIGTHVAYTCPPHKLHGGWHYSLKKKKHLAQMLHDIGMWCCRRQTSFMSGL